MEPTWDDTCAEVVELVSDYLDGALPPGRAEDVAAHLSGCPGCTEYVDQVRRSAASLSDGEVAEQLPADVRERLMAAFREGPREDSDSSA
jgi:anti-sigma factor RsiW